MTDKEGTVLCERVKFPQTKEPFIQMYRRNLFQCSSYRDVRICLISSERTKMNLNQIVSIKFGLLSNEEILQYCVCKIFKPKVLENDTSSVLSKPKVIQNKEGSQDDGTANSIIGYS